MSRQSSYDPLNNYNHQDYSYGQTLGAGGQQTVNAMSGPLLPHSVIGAPNIWRIAAVLDGTKDTKYTYKFNANDFRENGSSTGDFVNYVRAFPHGLSFAPSVEGSLLLGSNGVTTGKLDKYQLPYERWEARWGSGGQYTTLKGAIRIHHVDETNIYIEMFIYDGLMLSFFLGNYPMVFKFYCFADGTVA